MPELPVDPVLVLTWMLCVVLAAWLVRDWVLQRTARIASQVEHLRDRELILSYARMPVGLRLRTMFDEGSRRDAWRPLSQRLGLVAMRGLFIALIAAPLAVVSARLVTGEKVLGLFNVFRDAPEGSERLARTVLVMLAFAVLVRTYPVVDGWLDRKAQSLGKKPLVGMLGVIPTFATFHLLGLTPAFVLVLGAPTLVAGMQYQSWRQHGGSPVALTAHVVIYLILAVILLLVGAFGHYVRGNNAGIFASVLAVSVLLPLASAVGDCVSLAVVQALSRRIARQWPGVWGLVPYLLLAVLGCLVGVAVFLATLAAAAQLYLLVNPENYMLSLGPDAMAVLSNPAYGWPVWVLAAVKLLPVVDSLVRCLALLVTQRSAALRASVKLLADRASPAATAEMLIRAHSIGWIAVSVLVTVPLVLLVLAQA